MFYERKVESALFVVLFIILAAHATFAAKYDWSGGNRIEVISDPGESVNVKLDLIDQARHHIHIITYYWGDCEIGREFVEALRKAAARGVRVRVVTNYHINFYRDWMQNVRRYLGRPIENGNEIDYLCFSPFNSKNAFPNSLHEKLLIVDGRVVVVGGRNFSQDVFLQKDYDFLIEGPLVLQLQDHFKRVLDFVVRHNVEKCKEDDNECRRELLEKKFFADEKYFPEASGIEGGVQARLITNVVLKDQSNLGLRRSEREEYFAPRDDILNTVIEADFKKLRFYSFHVLPTRIFKEFLLSSLKQGKEIEIITNGEEASTYYSKAGYELNLTEVLDLVEQKAKVYFWDDLDRYSFMHAKLVIFDDDRAIIGSHNLNRASTVASNEIAIEIYSREFASQMIDLFENDKKHTVRATETNVEEEIEENSSRLYFAFVKLFENIIAEFF